MQRPTGSRSSAGVLLAIAMTGAIWLVTGYLFGDAITAVAAAGGVAGMFAVLWYVVPLRRLRRHR